MYYCEKKIVISSGACRTTGGRLKSKRIELELKIVVGKHTILGKLLLLLGQRQFSFSTRVDPVVLILYGLYPEFPGGSIIQ